MKLQKPIIIFLVVILVFSSVHTVFTQNSPIPSQTPEPMVPGSEDQYPAYSLGDKMFSINLGFFIPLFFQATTGDAASTNLSLGGSGALKFETFLNNTMAVGVQFSGSISFSPNDRTLILVPIVGTFSYFLRMYPFEFPIGIGAGINFTKLDTLFNIEPILKPSVGAYWIYNSEWSFGLNLEYHWIPQIYTGREGSEAVPADQTRFANFLTVDLSALYHF